MPKNVLRLMTASCYFDLDSYLFERVTKRFAQRHTLNAFDFYAIITWKSNRSKTGVQKGMRRKRLHPTRLMSKLSALQDDREKMQLLDSVPGIDIAIASAILTVCYPDRFTVLDYRAWETLHAFGKVPQQRIPTGVNGYFNLYLPACLSLASETKMSLRELDRTLWGWSMRNGISRLLTG